MPMDIVFQESEEQEGTRAVVARWIKQIGEAVAKNEPVLEVETDKVTVEVVAPEAGVLSELVVTEGDVLNPGDVVARVASESSEPAATPSGDFAKPESAAESTQSEPPVERPKLSPAVRKLLAKHELRADDIRGTGSKGRVTVRDVEQHVRHLSSAAVSEPLATVDLPATDSGGQRVPHTPMRRKIARHMVDSLLHTAPHVTSVFEADLSAIIAHRKANKADFAKQGVKLTFSAYFVQAASRALAEVPQVNSRFHEDYLEVFPQQHIGVGTALGDDGLVVPVLRNAESLNLFGTAERLDQLVEKARNKKLAQADLQGGTFTISNHGVSGSLVATPIIINQPQSAILGIGKLQKRVVVREVDGQDVMAIRPMCYVSLTIDHRALDAHQTNRFLTTFVSSLEEWA